MFILKIINQVTFEFLLFELTLSYLLTYLIHDIIRSISYVDCRRESTIFYFLLVMYHLVGLCFVYTNFRITPSRNKTMVIANTHVLISVLAYQHQSGNYLIIKLWWPRSVFQVSLTNYFSRENSYIWSRIFFFLFSIGTSQIFSR